MKAIVFLSILFSNAQASDFSNQLWSKGKDHFLFSYHAPSNLLISENCFNEKVSLEKSNCDAAKILNQKKSLTLASADFSGGKNPGAVVCGVGLKKQVIILKDSNENENAFCQFDDLSMVSAIELQSLLKD